MRFELICSAGCDGIRAWEDGGGPGSFSAIWSFRSSLRTTLPVGCGDAPPKCSEPITSSAASPFMILVAPHGVDPDPGGDCRE